MEQLKRKGVSLASRRSLCGEAEENLGHLLIHSSMIWGLWVAHLAILGADRVPPYSVRDLILG